MRLRKTHLYVPIQREWFNRHGTKSAAGHGSCSVERSYSGGDDVPVPVKKIWISVCRNGLDAQRIDFLENGLESLFQLFLGSRFSFCSCKLPVIGNGAPVKIGSFHQQVGLRIILRGHDSIL